VKKLTAFDRLVVSYRVAFAALTLAALVVQLINQIDRGGSVVNFFSFFTVQSNLIVTAVFLLGAWFTLKGAEPPSWRIVRGAAAAYMTTTGVVYVLLLTGLEEDLQTTLPWVNAVLHYWMPLVAIADWLIDRPEAISFSKALVWTVYPLAWLLYSMVRGEIGGWYPYPFLHPEHNAQGYAGVAVTSVVIFLAFVGLTWLLARTSGWRWRAQAT
jgi:hypothetical protein